MRRWNMLKVTEVPSVPGDADDPIWHPLQHYFGITAFGANVFAADADGQTLVDEHDEAGSGQEELYVVLEGSARFDLDGEPVAAERGTAIVVTEPSVRRSATASSAGTAVLVVGVRPGCFDSTWRESHFVGVPRA
jgi:hypothetical protein